MSDRVVNIVGVGNTLMGDDGVGPAAVERLLGVDLGQGAAVYDAGLAVSDVLGGLDPGDPLIIIDALRAGGTPGSVYRARLEEMEPEGDCLVGAISLHELNVFPALRMEEMTGRRFGRVTVFGVEPEAAEWGAELSPPVAGALDKLVETVAAFVRELLETDKGADACLAAAEGDPSL